MRSAPFFSSIHVKNFRTFKSLKIPSFGHFNIVGGFNASGKSALLEILFLALDLKNPLSLVKPFIWRNINLNGKLDLRQMFPTNNYSGKISCHTRDKKIEIQFTHELMPPNIATTMGSAILAQPTLAPYAAETTGERRGMHLKSKIQNVDDVSVFFLESNEGILSNLYQSSASVMPQGQYLSASVKGSSIELAQRLSHVIQEGKLPELMRFVSGIKPSIQTFQILQLKDAAAVFAVDKDHRLLPVQFMGDGFQTILSLAAGIVSLRNGVLLLDEIDSTIHYSLVRKMWCNIAKLAVEQNCQIFATSHSREAIMSMASGIADAGHEKEIQYLRIEPGDEEHRCVIYDYSQLVSAEEFSLEIR